MTRRYKYSAQFVRTNFSLGHDKVGDSTYRSVFNERPSPPVSIDSPDETGSSSVSSDHCHLVPSCVQCKYKALLSAFESPNLRVQPLKTKVQESQKDDTPKKTSHVTFGNDRLNHITAYKDLTGFTGLLHSGRRADGVVPPQDAQVLPHAESGQMAQRSSVRNDFTYFGPQINTSMYEGRVKELNSIQGLHDQDSVGTSLLGKRRKMLTRSMVDYQHPLDRVHGDIKGLMVQQISPYVRQDSIWSVNSEDKNINYTEARQQYIWPRSRGMYKRFLRGGPNDKVR